MKTNVDILIVLHNSKIRKGTLAYKSVVEALENPNKKIYVGKSVFLRGRLSSKSWKVQCLEILSSIIYFDDDAYTFYGDSHGSSPYFSWGNDGDGSRNCRVWDYIMFNISSNS